MLTNLLKLGITGLRTDKVTKTLTDIDHAIYYIEGSRDSHLSVIDCFDADPEAAAEEIPYAEAVGDREFHEKCIKEYDFVIGVLKSLKEKEDVSV